MVSTESTSVLGAKHAPEYAVVVLDGDGIVRLASGEVMDLFGWRPQELIGQPVEWLVPVRLRIQGGAQWHELAASARAGATPVAMEVLGLCREGFEFPIQVTVIAVGGTCHRLFSVVIRDLTDPRVRSRGWRASRRALESRPCGAPHRGTEPHTGIRTNPR